MSIPDPTIDPITGLPLLNPQDVIQQIPLGVQTFPWDDLVATARPTRNPMYGDDILPVSALLAGQHPSTGSAQTAETDGAHAIKVFVVNESGGGGNPTPVNMKVDWGGMGSVSANNVNRPMIFNAGTAIYGINWGWVVRDDTAAGADGHIDFALQNAASGHLQTLYTATIAILTAGDSERRFNDGVVWFDPPIDPVAEGWEDGSGTTQAVISNQFAYNMGVSLLVYHN